MLKPRVQLRRQEGLIARRQSFGNCGIACQRFTTNQMHLLQDLNILMFDCKTCTSKIVCYQQAEPIFTQVSHQVQGRSMLIPRSSIPSMRICEGLSGC